MKIQSKNHNETSQSNSSDNRIILGDMVVNIKYAKNENRLYDSLLNYFKTLKNIEK